MAILLSDQAGFISKNLTKDKEGCFIVISVSIPQEDRGALNTKNRVSKYMKQEQTELKGE